MDKAVWIISFKLKKNVTQEAFIAATQQLHDRVISKAKGFVSWEQYLQNGTWTDFVVWETLEGANRAVEAGHGSEEAKAFYALLQMHTCRMQITSRVKAY